MNDAMTERDIEAWQHTTWDDIAGNRWLKTYLQAMIRSIGGPQRGRGINTLVLGESRSGKTSTIEFAMKVLTCWNLDLERLLPCNQCQPCVQHQGRYELVEIDQILWGGPNQDLCFVPINGNDIAQPALEAEIQKAAGRWDLRWIYYIDEIQGLVRKHLDHMLFKAVEQHKHITWIVSTATTAGLDPMFRNRFTEVPTELPGVGELALLLAKRCRHPSINVTWDDDRTLVRLAERSRRLTGLALKCLAQAKMLGSHLSRELVENYPFDQMAL
jgi:hypothetical protein